MPLIQSRISFLISRKKATDFMSNRRPDIWLPTYLLTAASRAYDRHCRANRLTEIIFLVCDHFEPKHGAKDDKQPFNRLAAWQDGYSRLQEKCRISFNNVPVHTWFYPPHHGLEHLSSLSAMVFDGLGEVELHYHHDGDTEETLRRDLKKTLADYHRWGLLLNTGETPRSSFGFIHGDWALNNSGEGKYCGVNNETDILADLGCWGDMTMPSGNNCQTRKINSIYYAAGDTSRPKSHDWGRDARVGKTNLPGLFMMQGPLGINWHAPGYPRIENASLTSENWGRPDRIRKWLDCQIHVKGRPEWLFVKLHAHGAVERDFDALFGEKAFQMHSDLNKHFNDGQRYRLHYVTARQAYNIAKAAEHGHDGNAGNWRDYLVPPQPHSFYSINAAHDLLCCTSQHLLLTNIELSRSVQLRARLGPIREIAGEMSRVEIDVEKRVIEIVTTNDAKITIQLVPGFRLIAVEGGLTNANEGRQGKWEVRCGGSARIFWSDDPGSAAQ